MYIYSCFYDIRDLHGRRDHVWKHVMRNVKIRQGGLRYHCMQQILDSVKMVNKRSGRTVFTTTIISMC